MLNPVLPRSQQITYLVLFSPFQTSNDESTARGDNNSARSLLAKTGHFDSTHGRCFTGSASVPDTTLACHAFHELSSAADRSLVRYARRLRTRRSAI